MIAFLLFGGQLYWSVIWDSCHMLWIKLYMHTNVFEKNYVAHSLDALISMYTLISDPCENI